MPWVRRWRRQASWLRSFLPLLPLHCPLPGRPRSSGPRRLCRDAATQDGGGGEPPGDSSGHRGPGTISSSASASAAAGHIAGAHRTTPATLLCGILQEDRQKDLPATCNVGGAGQWRRRIPNNCKALACGAVVVIPNADDTGRAGGRPKMSPRTSTPAATRANSWIWSGHRAVLSGGCRAAGRHAPDCPRRAGHAAACAGEVRQEHGHRGGGRGGHLRAALPGDAHDFRRGAVVGEEAVADCQGRGCPNGMRTWNGSTSFGIRAGSRTGVVVAAIWWCGCGRCGSSSTPGRTTSRGIASGMRPALASRRC